MEHDFNDVVLACHDHSNWKRTSKGINEYREPIWGPSACVFTLCFKYSLQTFTCMLTGVDRVGWIFFTDLHLCADRSMSWTLYPGQSDLSFPKASAGRAQCFRSLSCSIPVLARVAGRARCFSSLSCRNPVLVRSQFEFGDLRVNWEHNCCQCWPLGRVLFCYPFTKPGALAPYHFNGTSRVLNPRILCTAFRVIWNTAFCVISWISSMD